MTPDANYPSLSELITTKEGLENVLGRPDPRVLAKVAKALDDLCLAFIARSPFIIVASHDQRGASMSLQRVIRRASRTC
jgi:hypothetical protein